MIDLQTYKKKKARINAGFEPAGRQAPARLKRGSYRSDFLRLNPKNPKSAKASSAVPEDAPPD